MSPKDIKGIGREHRVSLRLMAISDLIRLVKNVLNLLNASIGRSPRNKGLGFNGGLGFRIRSIIFLSRSVLVFKEIEIAVERKEVGGPGSGSNQRSRTVISAVSIRLSRPPTLSLALFVLPLMGLLHVLLAVRLSLGLVVTAGEMAGVEERGSIVLVVVVSFKFLLGRPTNGGILAAVDFTLVRTGVGLGVLIEVTLTWENFGAVLARKAARCRLSGFRRHCDCDE